MIADIHTDRVQGSVLTTLWKFALTGGLATILHYTVLAISLYIFGTSAAFGTALGYLAGAVLGYVANYTFTFHSLARHSKAVLSYFVMVGVGLILNTTLVWIGADQMGWPLWVVQIGATGIVFLFNFLGSRYWVFR